jgi:hypothetical protein
MGRIYGRVVDRNVELDVGIKQETSQCKTDHIFRIHQIPEKKWEYNEAVHQLFRLQQV